LIDANPNTSNQRGSLPFMSFAKMDSRDKTNTSADPTISKPDLGPFLQSKIKLMDGTVSVVETLGTIHQRDYMPRNSAGDTAKENGTVIPNGGYGVLLRALKITGDVQNEENYEVWSSPQLNIKSS
jgi:hypothetical protein